MKLEGIHHITAITEDGQRNVDFYVGVMGLRLVKKTVNQDQPTVYHLFYADEKGSAGSDLTFFEFPGVPARARRAPGWSTGSSGGSRREDSLDFWAERLAGHGDRGRAAGGALRFADPEGLEHELAVAEVADAPLIADHPEIPAELALQGFDAVRAYSAAPDASTALLEALDFERAGEGWEARGDEPRRALPLRRRRRPSAASRAPAPFTTSPGPRRWTSMRSGARRRSRAGRTPTPVIDRFYFRSIYFREPSGVLFEIATLGPGFTVDEPLESLGEKLSLPPDFEHLRDEVEPNLRPIVNPRVATKT